MKLYFGAGSGDLRADRRYEFALQMAEEGAYGTATDLLKDALSHAPQWPPIHFQLGEALRIQNLPDAAEDAFNQYLILDPADAMGAGVKLSLMGRRPPEKAMTRAYVQNLFDQYAPRFESALVGKLDYDIPFLLARMIEGSFQTMLDLGCGTGLVAKAFADSIPDMTGVDLSEEMIKIARQKGLYSRLFTNDLENHLDSHKDVYDLVICADVLIYLSDLETIFHKIACATCTDGLFAFSTQNHSGHEDWTLGLDHRYAHNPAYIKKLLKNAGFSCERHQVCDLRKDGNAMLKGDVYIARKIKA